MGEIRDRAVAIATLVEAFGVKIDDFNPARTRAYEDGVKEIPIPLLNAAVRKAIAERTFFPKVAELRQDAEACRKAVIAAHPFERCIECEHSPGWVEVQHADGVRAERCPCWTRHQQMLAQLGVGSAPLALPPAESVEFA